MQSGDGFIVILIVLGLAAWLYLYSRGRIKRTVEEGSPFDFLTGDDVPEDEAIGLLEEEGYRVVSGKLRIPIQIMVNDEDEVLHSRLFIDYVVKKGSEYFTVKLAKERKPLDMTGSAIREHLMIYQLLYPHTAGVLYVDLETKQVDRFIFDIDADDEE
ncbi:hypothetical protein [Paenibacillus cremeus]|uniref:Uncharacterized protein n=1 Tax=Paenibacillus cremeus TaxID=2163881 RepID=A0A559KHA9_9BACL|nr:hypothetical protein [Paenibacillus cremeus]TVY11511.1 hypothetical protein FPZ49_02080 [Paenibacillus cremeus]